MPHKILANCIIDRSSKSGLMQKSQPACLYETWRWISGSYFWLYRWFSSLYTGDGPEEHDCITNTFSSLNPTFFQKETLCNLLSYVWANEFFPQSSNSLSSLVAKDGEHSKPENLWGPLVIRSKRNPFYLHLLTIYLIQLFANYNSTVTYLQTYQSQLSRQY